MCREEKILSPANKMRVGIDATNLRCGGGLTHLQEMLSQVQPQDFQIEGITIWGSIETLNLIIDAPWLTKLSPPALNKGLIPRTLWQIFYLKQALEQNKCIILFSPGGSYIGSFRPSVTMSRNLLPFEFRESIRYGISLRTLKMLALRVIQSYSYRNASGVIFLTQYALTKVGSVCGKIKGEIRLIPHGMNSRFIFQPKTQKGIGGYSEAAPYKVLYVSTIDEYKHQWNVIKGLSTLRLRGLPIVLDLVGPYYPKSFRKLKKTMQYFDLDEKWIFYRGSAPFSELHNLYSEADMGLFASSCENMPNILIEKMASGLPIACSNRGPMPEILRDGGLYFDPECPENIGNVVLKLINSPDLRQEISKKSFQYSHEYSWNKCAKETLTFLTEIASAGNK
jgi:glycosyltransferase involved in cell wall biosynthesis